MNRRPLVHAAASAALGVFAAVAAATPGPPLGCGGQPGVGGCAPFINISFTDAAGSVDPFGYDLPGIDIGRSRPLSDLERAPPGGARGGRWCWTLATVASASPSPTAAAATTMT